MNQELRHLSVGQAYAAYRTRPSGLSEPEARTRLAQYGPNLLAEPPVASLWKRLLAQFTHTMALLLWVSSVLAWTAGMPELGLAICAVNLINGTFSFWQEHRAERATAELKRLLPHHVRVIREGRCRELEAAELVPGDVVELGEGDNVSADCRLVEAHELRIDQSCLTGESMPVAKSFEPLERNGLGHLDAGNLVFAGSNVVSGTGKGVVFATGMASEFGKIARLTQEQVEHPSPLQQEIHRVTRVITYMALFAGAVFLLLATALAKMPVALALPFALGMVVAFVPEGLAPTLTLALAMAVQRMARRKALVKRLASVETLGAASVICTDKTGTLTQNRMTVVHVWSLPDCEPELLRACALCNDASLEPRLGDPMEIALLAACRERGVDPEAERREHPRLGVLPFDSRKKCMTTLHEGAAYLKGAPSVVLPRCPDADYALIRAKEDEFARRGLRVLGFARDDRFLGLVALHDPPRPEVPEALRRCHEAGIRIVMITGDHGVTAEAIARETGLVRGPEVRVVTGVELDAMHEKELQAALSGEVIFARSSPENKLKVVEALQRRGEVVAVTGDGVNDAPALKRADIGVAMGKSGSDVAREAADMVLADDSFASIVCAIEEGRAVYANIRHFISYIFTSNVPEAVPLIVHALSGGRIPLALTVMQILCIDLGTDMVPALALGTEPPEPGTMKLPPRAKDEHLITRALLVRSCLFLGVAEAALAMGAFFLAQGQGYASATTLTLGAVIAAQIGNGFTHRNDRRSLFQAGLFRNRLLWAGVALEVALLAALAYLPVLQKAFGTAPIEASGWLYLLACAPALLVLDELRKFFLRRRGV